MTNEQVLKYLQDFKRSGRSDLGHFVDGLILAFEGIDPYEQIEEKQDFVEEKETGN